MIGVNIFFKGGSCFEQSEELEFAETVADSPARFTLYQLRQIPAEPCALDLLEL